MTWDSAGISRRRKKCPGWIDTTNWSNSNRKNGHFQVSITEDKALCYWLNDQRKLYRSGKLRKDKKKLLDKIDFAWTASGGKFKPAPITPVHAFDANTVHNKEEAISKTESEASTSFITAQGSPKVGQKFPVGTRIENAFQVDGISQTFGGSIAAFEYFEDEHGAKAWGYLIYYDDGDREHMLEADVAKNLVVVKSKKRTAKSHLMIVTEHRP